MSIFPSLTDDFSHFLAKFKIQHYFSKNIIFLIFSYFITVGFFANPQAFLSFFVQICVSPPRNLHFPRNEGVGEGLQKHIMHNGEPTRAKEQAFVVLFFFLQ